MSIQGYSEGQQGISEVVVTEEPSLRERIKEFMRAEAEEGELRERTSFYCTDNEKNQFDLYHAWLRTPYTNPMTPESKVSLGTRKLVELSIVSIFRKMGILVEGKDKEEQRSLYRIEMIRNGVKVTGYKDAIIKEGLLNIPVEIKTSDGYYALKELEAGTPKSNYLKQLAQYIDYDEAPYGYLFQMHFEAPFRIKDMYQFKVEVIKQGDGSKVFRCNEVEFDIWEVYKRWANIYNTYIEPKIEPPSEFRYKFPIEEIDWTKLSTKQISDARNNHSVIGNWEVKYSSYKDLIIEREGTELGYTDAELKRINEITKGYTSKKKE